MWTGVHPPPVFLPCGRPPRVVTRQSPPPSTGLPASFTDAGSGVPGTDGLCRNEMPLTGLSCRTGLGEGPLSVLWRETSLGQ